MTQVEEKGAEPMTIMRLGEEAQKLQDAWTYLREHGAIGLYDECGPVKIHLDIFTFLEIFPKYVVVPREFTIFRSYELQAYVGTSLFFALTYEKDIDVSATKKKAASVAAR